MAELPDDFQNTFFEIADKYLNLSGEKKTTKVKFSVFGGGTWSKLK